MRTTWKLWLCCLSIAVFAACGTDAPAGSGQFDGDVGTDGNQSDVSEDSCSSAQDCNDAEVCVMESTSGDLSCEEPPGDGQTGDSCSSGSDCASGICLNGTCADPCSGDADCPSGYACREQSIPLDGGGSTTVDVCVEQDQPCAANEDCNPPDVCTVDRSGDAIDLNCNSPVGSGQLGDDCSSDGDCASNLCVDGTCSAPCERSADCNDGDGFQCEPTQVDLGGGGTEEANVCRPEDPSQCGSDADCSGSQRCIANKSATQIEFRCGDPNPGGGETGADCSTDTDCAQNLCLNAKCAGPCESDGDCSSATDYACEITQVNLSGGSDNAEVCVPPRPCDSIDDCRVGTDEVCYAERASGSIDSSCQAPNSGGSSLGDTCNEDRNCAANLCYGSRFADVCTVPCDDDGDCDTPGYICDSVDVDDADGNPVTTSLCVPGDLDPCTTQADCDAGTSCAVVPNQAGDALETVCVPTGGRNSTGLDCTDDDDCGSRVCLNDFCAAPCERDNDCGSEQICTNNSVSKSSLSANFDLCETLPEEQCDDDGTCSDGIRVCSDLRFNSSTSTLEAYCQFPNTNQGGKGDSCVDASECTSNFCRAGSSDECSVACANDGQCSPNQTCVGASDNGAEVCMTSCVDNDSCSGLDANGALEHVCKVTADVPDREVEQVCDQKNDVDPSDSTVGQLGDTCTSSSECQTEFCVRIVTYTNTPCTSDADCSGSDECVFNGTEDVCGQISDRRCSALCDQDADCQNGASGNTFTSCDQSVGVRFDAPQWNFTINDTVSACAPPN